MLKDITITTIIAGFVISLLWLGIVKETDRQACLYWHNGNQYYNYEKCED